MGLPTSIYADSKSEKENESRNKLATPTGLSAAPTPGNAATSITVTFNTPVANAASYTVRLYDKEGERLIGQPRTNFTPGGTITSLTSDTNYRVSVQAIAATVNNSSNKDKEKDRNKPIQYTNSEESKKVIVKTAVAAAPAFTLSPSSKTVTVNTVVTGFTINSTGGAIASFGIDATPPGMSFDTTTGALTGTPNTVAPATTYTVTATNATGTATQIFTLTVAVAAPAFTLSPSSKTVTVNTVVTGFTINSTGGAIASFGIDATPPGMSFDTTTGALTGTPNTVAPATTYTVTATNATGTATQIFTLTVTATCANGGPCIVGDRGPGGGKIFYVAATPFTCGPTLAETCTYLEAAPTSGANAWTDVLRTWSTGGNQSVSVNTADGTAIGTGFKNSSAIVAQLSNVEESSAAVAARRYGGPNSLIDWYLPSKDELNQMCKWQRGTTGEALTNLATVCTGGTLNSGSGAAGFVAYVYWSSTEYDSSDAWLQGFDNGNQGENGFDKINALYVRPVRAF